MLYFAYIHKSNSGYSGFFPAVEGCYFAGDTFEDTVVEAYSALKAHFELLIDEDLDIPLSKSVSNYLDDEDCKGGIWVTVNIDISKFDKRAKRVQITLPSELLKNIDLIVNSLDDVYQSRSSFLAIAAKKELDNLKKLNLNN